MRVLSGLICILSLAGCDLTDPRYLGAPVTRVAIGSDLFEVRQRGDTALALRITPAPPQRYAVAMTRAVLAIEQATGCLVLRAGGDPSAAQARLECGADARPSRQPVEYQCDAFEVHDGLLDLSCRPGL